MTYNTSVLDQAHFDAFRVILKACLVDGYGLVPAAGWELIHSAANSIVLRNGTHSGYVCFQRTPSTSSLVTVWLAATYSGVDAAGKIIGDGVRSGTAANSSAPHRLQVRALAARSESSTWAMVADNETFVLSMSGSSSVAPIEVTGVAGQSYEANLTFYCGSDSFGDFICAGGANSESSSASLDTARFSSAGFTCLKHPDTGLLVDTGAITVFMPGTVVFNNATLFSGFPSGVVLSSAHLSPLSWIANSVVRRLRGIAVDPRLSYAYNSPAAQALGGPALTTRTMNTLLDLGDGHDYLIGRAYYTNAITMLLTTHPEFW